MKKRLLLLLILFFTRLALQAQATDTLVDVGGYTLHFYIIKGSGMPIIFEAGGGDDATAWRELVQPIAAITQATVITYDRPGFGKSTIDSKQHGIDEGVKGLEKALQQLGYGGNCMLVAHSQGSFTATLFAARNPLKVKSAVFVDASTACWFLPRLKTLQEANDRDRIKIELTRPGQYFQLGDLTANVNLIINHPFPLTIPVFDLVSELPISNVKSEADDWKRCHQEFVNLSPNRTGLLAFGTGHYIFRDNPAMVINTITKAYAQTLTGEETKAVLQRGIDYAITSSNIMRKEEAAYRHSENDLNSWGYQLLQNGNMEGALAVFKLNVILHPGSANVYDSYAEALLKNGEKAEALKMYRKAVELDPKNENAKRIIGELKG